MINMSKSLYFANNNTNIEKKVINTYNLILCYQDDQKSIYKNSDMLMEVERQVITVLVYDIYDYELINKIKKELTYDE